MSMKFLIVSVPMDGGYNLEEAMEREEFDGMIPLRLTWREWWI